MTALGRRVAAGVWLALACSAGCSRAPRQTRPPVAGPVTPPPAVVQPSGRVYVHGKLVDLDTHALIAEVGGNFRTSAQDPRDAFVFDGGGLRAIELATGKDRWHDAKRFCMALRLAGEQLYCVAGDGLTVIDRATGRTRWHQPELGPDDLEFGRLLLLPDIVVISTGKQPLRVLAAGDGKPLPAPTLTGSEIALDRVGAGFCAWHVPGDFVASCCDHLAQACVAVTVTRPPPRLDARWSLLDGGSRFALVGEGDGVIVELPSGQQTRAGQGLSALARNRDGSAAGLLFRGAAASFQDLDQRRHPLPPLLDGAVPPLAVGDRLLVASYFEMTTGAALLAVDLGTDRVAWTADVQEWPVDHSKYWNQVELELRGSHVLLWGHESSNDYLQVFDLATGQREFVDRVD